mgnify:CR=1 FL=1
MTDNTVETINSSELADLINAAPVPSPNNALGVIVDELNINDVVDTGVVDISLPSLPLPVVVEVQQDEQDQVSSLD